MTEEQKEILLWAADARNFLVKLWNDYTFSGHDLADLLATVPLIVTETSLEGDHSNENRKSVTPDCPGVQTTLG